MGKELTNLFMATPIENPLGSDEVRAPAEIAQASGIMLQGRWLKSFAFTTDVAVIHNTNADAILAVYPFTGQPVINQAILSVAQAPVFIGVDGGTTAGPRVLELAMFAEMQGAAGVVLNSPIDAETVSRVAAIVHVPVVATVTGWNSMVGRKIDAGARIINVAAGKDTPEVVARIKERYPSIPLIASSGGSPESIRSTMNAGANALSWTPPSVENLQKEMMRHYRKGESAHGNKATDSSPTHRMSGDSAHAFLDTHDVIDTHTTHEPRHKLRNQIDIDEC
ncbi:dioxygenase [Bifidobacterium tibiigranuli]|uniref:dioxygenase n=2 Tax=Bifidobacterium tibiigranuli TaxID=2172043 RepID=UPI00192A6BD0|nr:dioxygenase [Bifidobacterium tibiigranuli]